MHSEEESMYQGTKSPMRLLLPVNRRSQPVVSMIPSTEQDINPMKQVPFRERLS